MAEFSIIFDEMLNSPPRYEDYSVTGPLGSCGEDAQIHSITFNDISTGDYVVGYNWNSPIGLPPGYTSKSLIFCTSKDFKGITPKCCSF